jgi:hypothetical protein
MTISVRAFAPDRERRAAAFEEAPNWLTQHGELTTAAGLPILAKIANRLRPGITSRKSSIRLAARSPVWFDRPVTLPPGLARLATRPVPTGSPAVAKTIGMTNVACFAARTGGVECVTMTSTLSRTNSAAMRLSAQRTRFGGLLIPASSPSPPARPDAA